MRASRLLLLGFASLGAGTANAADLFVDDPQAIAAAADYDWSGAYVGAFAGVGGGDVALSDPDGIVDPLDLAAGGWLAGIRAGVNADAGVLVFGAEADIAATAIGGSGNAAAGGFNVDYGYDLDWLGTVTGRVGFAADTLLLYAKGGLAAGGVRSTRASDAPLAVPASADALATGWTLGLGTEFAFSENVTAGIEYDFVSLATQFDYSDATAADATADLHIVKLGVNYGF